MTRDMFYCRNHLPVLSSFVAYCQVCNKSNTTGVTCEARTAGVHSWFLLSLCCHTLVAGAIFCRSLSLLFGHCIVYPFWPLYCLSFLAIVLSLLFGRCIVSPFWPLYCLSFFDLWLLIKLLVLSNFWGPGSGAVFYIFILWVSLSFLYFHFIGFTQFFIFSFYRFHSVFYIFIL